MRTLCLLLVGVALGWAAGGVDCTRDAVGQDGVRNPNARPLELSVDEEAMLADELNLRAENSLNNDARRPPGRVIPITYPGRYQLKVFGDS